VSELNGECLESVSFRHVVLDAFLELSAGKALTSDSLMLVVGERCGHYVAELAVVFCSHIVVVSSHAGNLVPDDALQELLLLYDVNACRWHEVANGWAWSESIDHGRVHSFPLIFVLEVPVSVDHSIVSLDVGEEILMVEDAPYLSVESMHSWVVLGHLRSGQALPEVYFLLAMCVWRLSGHDPGVGSLTIGSYADISVQAEA